MAAVAAGADALGLVFHARSERALGPAAARELVRTVPPFVSLVGLFVDEEPGFVERVCAALPLDLLQFHGEETPEYCARFELPWIKAIRVRQGEDPRGRAASYSGAAAILLDTWSADRAGGAGRAFDWALVPEERPWPLILAGGLRAENVRRAIAATRPYAVDVSSGVESGPGLKEALKIERFVAAVRAADGHAEAPDE